MILDKCKNCKYYEPDERKFKEIFSNEVNTKYLRQGTCDIRILSIPNQPGGMYRRVNDDGWCEKFERKTKEENKYQPVSARLRILSTCFCLLTILPKRR